MPDLTTLRDDTPGTHQVMHFNNAGAALQPSAVLNAVTAHLHNEALWGGYEAAALASAPLDAVYRSIARLLNAHPQEIAVVENATRAWDMAFYALPLQPGEVILTSSNEYVGNYIPYLQLQRQRGIEIQVLADDNNGQVSLSALAERLAQPGVALVSLPLLGTDGGPLQPVREIGALCRAAGVTFLLDACQGVGQLPLDVREIGCHILTATSRKYLRGPRGMGFLYIEKGLCEQLEPPFLDLHAATLVGPAQFDIRSDARRFEAWECNVAAKLGLGAAVDYALEVGVERIWERIQQLAGYLRRELSGIAGVQGEDAAVCTSGIVTFTLDACSPLRVKQVLAQASKPINVSVTRGRTGPERVRASVHAYNTEAEIDALVAAVRGITAV
ncbi:MAG: aminotransferase class V-fold PLP-dependent enzyme [Pseudomonas sp.]|nr:aminotransferase class V-fold PLP-dependent enzyme [Pseudomonas sp.]